MGRDFKEATAEEKVVILESENAMLKEQSKQIDTYLKQYEILSGFTHETLKEPHFLCSKELHILNNKGVEAFYTYLRGKVDALDEEREKKFGFDLPPKK